MLIVALISILMVITVIAGRPAHAVPTATHPHHIALNPSTNRIFVGHLGDTRGVDVIHGDTNQKVATIPTGLNSVVDLNTTTNLLYAATTNPDTLSKIDASTYETLRQVPIPAETHVLIVNPITNNVYVGDQAVNSVQVLDGNTLEVIDRIPINANEAVLNPKKNHIWLSRAGTNLVSVVDGATNEVITSIPLPYLTVWPAFNPNTDLVYVSHPANDAISVIDADTLQFISTIPVGDLPFGVEVNPQTNHVLVVNRGSDSVTTINGMTNRIVSTRPVGDEPIAVVANPLTNRFYVSNFLSHNVSVIYAEEFLRNPSFELNGRGDFYPDGWRVRNLEVGDGIDSTSYDGKVSLRFNGRNGVKKQLIQKRESAGVAGVILNLEGFSKAQGPSPSGGAYKIRVEVTYADDTSESFAIHFPKNTHNWKRRATSFTAAKDFKQLTTHIIYENQTGTVWFDALHLWPGE